MNWLRQRFAPGYDLFKLLVAVVLIVLLILSLRAQQAVSKSQTVDTSTSASTATQVPTPLATRTQLPMPTFTSQPDTPAPTLTSQPVTATSAETPLVATEAPVPTELSPTDEPTLVADSGCPSLQSRVKIGDNVRVLLRLNFRKGPGLEYPIIQTNGVGTNLEVVGGPICNIRATSTGSKAYLWWNVRMANGMEGWSAEAPLVNSFYFLDPVK